MHLTKRGLAVALCALTTVASATEGAAVSDINIHSRGVFQNARTRFTREKKGHVAFIGGSITEMNGYRPMVMQILKRRFPETKFTFTDAGISSTCSTTGAHRLQDHVLSKGDVDLFFIEFAVNDDQDAGHARRECIRGMEGLVRRTRLHNPNADIVVTFFVNEGMLKTCRAGRAPLTSGSHTMVTEHYRVPTIDLARELADRVEAGTMTWKQFGGVHPGKPGNQLCADMIDHLMSRHWNGPIQSIKADPLPEPLDKNSYFDGRLVAPEKARVVKDMKVEYPEWKTLPGSCRARFLNEKLLCGEKAGSEATLGFEGRGVGAYILAGPDAGIVEVSVDGGATKEIDLYHKYSRGLHYPRTVMFDADLKPGKHTLRLRVSEKKNARSRGNAVRILYFTVNGPAVAPRD